MKLLFFVLHLILKYEQQSLSQSFTNTHLSKNKNSICCWRWQGVNVAGSWTVAGKLRFILHFPRRSQSSLLSPSQSCCLILVSQSQSFQKYPKKSLYFYWFGSNFSSCFVVVSTALCMWKTVVDSYFPFVYFWVCLWLCLDTFNPFNTIRVGVWLASTWRKFGFLKRFKFYFNNFRISLGFAKCQEC